MRYLRYLILLLFLFASVAYAELDTFVGVESIDTFVGIESIDEAVGVAIASDAPAEITTLIIDNDIMFDNDTIID